LTKTPLIYSVPYFNIGEGLKLCFAGQAHESAPLARDLADWGQELNKLQIMLFFSDKLF